MAEQLAKSRASLEKELSAAQNTIMELRDEVARLQADSIRGSYSGILEETIFSQQTSEAIFWTQTNNEDRDEGYLGDVEFDATQPLGPQLKVALQKLPFACSTFSANGMPTAMVRSPRRSSVQAEHAEAWFDDA